MRVFVILLSVLMLCGCAGLMVGGGSTGGYQHGKDERAASVAASDAAITTKIKGRYAADSIVSVFNVGVRTWQGTVTLSGTVGSYLAREQAESIAKGTGGVRAVNNHIVVADRSAAE